MKFNIAVGKNRLSKKWRNIQITWDDLVKKVSTTHRTHETVNEYNQLDKKDQDIIKDIGGFVGGYLSGGRRLASSVVSRQLITLDADEAKPEFWDIFKLLFDCSAAIYSTHKHTPEKPRYRLLIPLTREVMKDEYSAICRRIAFELGIDQFDHTGYQFHRLMYWPSTSKDGVFFSDNQTGPFLDPDIILNTYTDWQDVSEWPIGSKESKVVADAAKKQGDPYAKPGLIGAFNREYSIEEAIDIFLPDIYEKSSISDRYTFKLGSTAAGAIVYDDKFLYSHHSTDPVCEKLCSSFDLVRIHKFGMLDSDDPDIPINKRPSYLAMSDLASGDARIKQQIGESKLEHAKEVFSNVLQADNQPDEEDEKSLDWLKLMDIDRKGQYYSTINNIALILEHDEIFKNCIGYDEFEQQPVFKRNIPWRSIAGNPGVTDNDLAYIENYIEKIYKIATGTNKIQKGLSIIYEKNRFHPVRDYLSLLTWDGHKRLETLFIDYLGVEDSEYTRVVTKKALVACVARIFQPGIKFDNVLTFIGPEGEGKSTLLNKLGGQWFSDTFNMHMLQGKEAYEQIQGVWIIEISELAGMAKIEVERIKGFISSQKDRYRSPYSRSPDTRLRQCVFFGSTNNHKPLRSQTGNRRFWPVETNARAAKYSVHAITKDYIDQVWAEAVYSYLKGYELHLSKSMYEQAKIIQEIFTEKDPWVDIIIDYLDKDIPSNWYSMTKYDMIDFINGGFIAEDVKLEKRDKVCVQEIWEIALKRRELIDTRTYNAIVTAMSKIPNWCISNELLRFGVNFPRQRGAYVINQLRGTEAAQNQKLRAALIASAEREKN